MKFFKLFQSHSDYNTYINSQDKILPNVSYCENENEVHFNHIETRVIVKFNVTDTSSATAICFQPQLFNEIEIDGVTQPSVVDAYTFDTTGEHTVKYTLVDPTSIDYAFYSCSDITSISIPNSVTTIGESVFESCSGLTSITIPNSVRTIGNYAFQSCSSLTSITIPNSITTIGNYAFNGCTNLTSITIPNSITSIGKYAFYNCTSFTSITIPNNVTSIGEGTFYQCIGLTSVTIPNSVTSIGQMAFSICTNLTNVTIPNSISTIGISAFANCSSLISITVQATIPPTLDRDSFSNNASGRKIYVPSASVEAYKTANNWSSYENDIEAIQ